MCSDWCLLMERHETSPDSATIRYTWTRFGPEYDVIAVCMCRNSRSRMMIACRRKTMTTAIEHLVGCRRLAMIVGVKRFLPVGCGITAGLP